MQDFHILFEEFNPSGGRFTPLISVNETGGIGVSSGFVKKYNVTETNTKGVKLYFNRGQNIVGIRFTDKDEPGLLKLKFAPRGGAYINARSFWVNFDISYSDYKNKYLPTVTETPDGTVYTFELKFNPPF